MARRPSASFSSALATTGIVLALFLLLLATHASLLRLPYFWDEAGYYIPASRDLLSGSLIPNSTPSNAHPPLVMAALALAWKVFGQSLLVTRVAMLAFAAFALAGFFRLARSISNIQVAVAATALLAIYPVFFAQASLAQVDLPAAGLTFWGWDAYFRKRPILAASWFSLAALAKETAILIPAGIVAWELLKFVLRFNQLEWDRAQALQLNRKDLKKAPTALLVPVIPLACWYAYHHARTGFVFGNPEFLRYNLEGNLTPLRIALALLLRLWQTAGYLNLYVLTIACLVAMRYSAQPFNESSVSNERAGRLRREHSRNDGLRPRIDIPIQLSFLTVAVVYLLAMAILGGAVLARYMLPIVPLMILICVSTIWRRLRFWKSAVAIVALSFLAGLLLNPPYGFSPEDNLAYADYIRLHQRAESFIAARYPNARVLTAWPASDELSRPYLGYVQHPIKVVRIEDFTAEHLMATADERSAFDLALVFSTKYQAPHSFIDRWRAWQDWKKRFFGYHVDLTPVAAASVLGGDIVYQDGHAGQWVAIIQLRRIEEALARPPN